MGGLGGCAGSELGEQSPASGHSGLQSRDGDVICGASEGSGVGPSGIESLEGESIRKEPADPQVSGLSFNQLAFQTSAEAEAAGIGRPAFNILHDGTTR